MLLRLFLVFFKIGAFTFGGGYAMLSIIHREIVEKNEWITDDEMLNIIGIAEATPGVISVNSATFVGYKMAGIKGALVATLGTIIPSFVIIILITLFFMPYMDKPIIKAAFEGINACVVVLILRAAIKLNKANKRNVFNIAITVAAVFVSLFTEINAIYIILTAAAIGLCGGIICKK